MYYLYVKIGIVSLFGVWQIYLYTRLLSLAEDAENDMEQFHGFVMDHASLLQYFQKGIVLLLLWSICFACYFASHDHARGLRQEIPGIIFGYSSLFLLVPMYKIVISPSYKKLGVMFTCLTCFVELDVEVKNQFVVVRIIIFIFSNTKS